MTSIPISMLNNEDDSGNPGSISVINFLLSWNPRRSEWPERIELIRKLRGGGIACTRWGVRTKAIEPGDHVFFIRLGLPPRGIFARGSALTSSYLDSHWNETKRAKNRTCRFVDVQLVEMLDAESEPLLDLGRLRSAPFDEMHWTIQGSGVFIPARVADALELEWRRLIKSTT